MNKSFEDKIKAAVDSAQPQVPQHNWDKIQNKLDHPFEASLQSKFEQFGPTPNPALWASIEATLPNSMEASIQDKVSGFEQAPPAHLWENISGSMEEIPGGFEHALQDKFADFGATPPAGTFDGIEARMDHQSPNYWRRVVLPIVSMAAVALIFVMLPNATHDGKVSNATALEKGAPSLSDYDMAGDEKPGSINDNFFGTASNGSEENNTNFLAADHASKNKGTQDVLFGEENDNSPGANVLAAHSASSGSNPLSSGSHTRTVGHGSSHSGSNVLGSGHNGSAGSNAFAQASSIRTALAIAAMTPFEVNDLEHIAPNFPFHIPGSDMPFSKAAEASIESPEPTKVNTISVAAASGFFNVRNKSRYPSSGYGSEYVDFHNTLYTGGSYVSIGSDIQIAMSEKRSIISGLNVTSGKQYMSFDTYKKETPSFSLLRDEDEVVTNNYNPTSDLLNKKETDYSSVLSVVDQEEIAGDSVVNGNRYSMTNSFVFVDIPLGLNFKILDKKKHSINVRGGAMLRLVAGANTFHLTQNRDQMVEVSSAISQTFYQSSMASFAAVDYSHDLGENMEWYIGPEVAMNLSDINKAGTWISMRPVQAGISLGLRQQLN